MFAGIIFVIEIRYMSTMKFLLKFKLENKFIKQGEIKLNIFGPDLIYSFVLIARLLLTLCNLLDCLMSFDSNITKKPAMLYRDSQSYLRGRNVRNPRSTRKTPKIFDAPPLYVIIRSTQDITTSSKSRIFQPLLKQLLSPVTKPSARTQNYILLSVISVLYSKYQVTLKYFILIEIITFELV